MIVSLIVCMARNGVIGRDGGMPWRMPSDLAHFKAATMGKPMIMGRKTFVSLGRPLPGRAHFVITRQSDLPKLVDAPLPPATSVVRVESLDAAIAAATGAPEIMILGGGQIFAAALPRADRIYQTILDVDLDGDTIFPALPRGQWREVSRTPLATGAKDDYAAQVVVLDRVR